MRFLLFFFLLIIFSNIKLYGQKYDYYSLSFRSVYLPIGLVKGEAYFIDNKKDNRHIKFCNKYTNDSITKIELEENNFTTKYIETIDSLIIQDEFQITVESKFKDTIFFKITKANLNSFSRKEYDNYFINDTNITLSINKFMVDSFLENIIVLDEPWYTLNIEYHKINSNDTINEDIIFVGSDYMRASNIKNWLIGFIVLNRMKLFNNIPTIKENISEQNLNEVIVRYIITQEKRRK